MEDWPTYSILGLLDDIKLLNNRTKISVLNSNSVPSELNNGIGFNEPPATCRGIRRERDTLPFANDVRGAA